MNVLILTSNPNGACEYYRGIGVLSKIKGLNLKIVTEVGWSVLSQTDILFSERPILQGDLDIIGMAKDFGVPVWVDVDDDFFSVPDYNPAKRTFHKKDVQERHAQSLALADVVTVTTQYLKDSLGPFNQNIHVVPNAFNDIHWKWEFNPGHRDLIAWRGSETHRDDIRRYLGDMIKAQSKNEKEWGFIGSGLWFVQERLDAKKTEFVNELATIQYWRMLRELGAKYWQVPLMDNTFNRAKSNIGWIEATYAGAVCLCPDMDEWRNPGAVLYKPETDTPVDPGHSESFAAGLHLMFSMPEKERRKRVELSFEHIRENLLLSKVNEKRKQIIESIARNLST